MTAVDPRRDRPSRRATTAPDDEATALAAALRAAVRGDVRFDSQARAAYATDASNYRQAPIGVVVPRDVEDIEAAVAVCRDAGVPLLGRGAGTSLAGQCCNAAVILDCSTYVNRIVALDPDARTATVEPGVVLDALRDAAAPYGLTYGPDPSTHAWCTMGGVIGNNSCGVHALMAGKAVDNLEALDVVTADGLRLTVGATPPDELARIITAGGPRGALYRGLRDLRDAYEPQIRAEYPGIPRRVSGYNLDELLDDRGFHVARALCGTESTCALTLRATVRLVPSPPQRRLLVLGFPDVFVAGDAVPTILEHGPIGCEVMDRRLVGALEALDMQPEAVAMLPHGDAWLLVEFGADDRPTATAAARALAGDLDGVTSRLFDDPADEDRVWDVRGSALGATSRAPGQLPTWGGWEDSAVHPDRIGDYLRDLTALWDAYGYDGALYGHIGDGCVHTRNTFDLETPTGIATWRRYLEDAADLCVAYGGSLSGEHGDGQARGELLDRMYSAELLDAFRAFKRLWDPDGRMNPGKVIDARPLDSDLRPGTDVPPVDLGPTTLAFPEDGDRVRDIGLRCVGVGRCRRPDTGGMCPSFQVTRDEVHSTRGRARLLSEMVRGEVTAATWRNTDVADALDLCISCKACASECPVDVDMAAYKAEFRSHHHRGRPRPRSHYVLGTLDLAARAAARIPRAANAVARPPLLLRRVLPRLLGLTPHRPLPRVAARSFTDWFRDRPVVNPDGPPVVLWPDTFSNAFTPAPARAAVAVLEHLGFRVRLPDRALCCGRPLYDLGMLTRAGRLLGDVLDALRDDIAAGVPVVGVEPSCLAVFRDELRRQRPDDPDAARLAAQTHSLAEFVLAHRGRWGATDGRTPARALLQGHCHQTAVWGVDADVALLSALGVDTELVPTGCCGLAGAFGFEDGHYELSMRIGEQTVFPAVRGAGADTVVVADGFSCRTQIAHGTQRDTAHLAEVLRDAFGAAHDGPPDDPRRGLPWRTAAAALAVGAGWLISRRAR